MAQTGHQIRWRYDTRELPSRVVSQNSRFAKYFGDIRRAVVVDERVAPVFVSPPSYLGNDNSFLTLGCMDEIADRIALHPGLLAIQVIQHVIDVPSRVRPAIYDSIDCDRGMPEL